MRILIIGGGGREHALADTFGRHVKSNEIFVAPGNSGIAKDYTCLHLTALTDVLNWCNENNPDIVFIGPEQPLADGWADALRAQDIPCIGPSRKAARIETSKIFAKELMARYGIPTAEFHVFGHKTAALDYLSKSGNYPLVIKADGLAAGKGVVIAQSKDEAIAAIHSLADSEASRQGIIIEDFLQGWEVSLFVFTDGVNQQSTLFVQDYKQLNDYDQGPNTGGMGAYCPIPEAEAYRSQITDTIVNPILKAMRDEGCPFEGVLYCGLMITERGPYVLEFNCRFGDPETQALLPLLETPLHEICLAILEQKIHVVKPEWKKQDSICVVLCAEGYPQKPRKGDVISGYTDLQSKTFFSGVKETAGELVTNGGRILSLVSTGHTIEHARGVVYRDAERIEFVGKHYRRDISQRSNSLQR